MHSGALSQQNGRGKEVVVGMVNAATSPSKAPSLMGRKEAQRTHALLLPFVIIYLMLPSKA